MSRPVGPSYRVSLTNKLAYGLGMWADNSLFPA